MLGHITNSVISVFLKLVSTTHKSGSCWLTHGFWNILFPDKPKVSLPFFSNNHMLFVAETCTYFPDEDDPHAFFKKNVGSCHEWDICFFYISISLNRADWHFGGSYFSGSTISGNAMKCLINDIHSFWVGWNTTRQAMLLFPGYVFAEVSPEVKLPTSRQMQQQWWEELENQ